MVLSLPAGSVEGRVSPCCGTRGPWAGIQRLCSASVTNTEVCMVKSCALSGTCALSFIVRRCRSHVFCHREGIWIKPAELELYRWGIKSRPSDL